MEILLLGPDGLDPVLVNQWKDELPTISKLINEGSTGRLRSSHPPLTAPAWPTMYTGKQGGKHGTFGFTRPINGSYEQRAINYSEIKSESLWEILDAEDYSCGIVNVPLTYPPSNLENGFLIAGWPVPKGADITHDDDILEDLEEELGRQYDVYPFPPVVEYNQVNNKKLYREISSGLTHHGNAYTSLIENYGHELDLFFAVFNATDVAGHAFSWDEKYLKQTYIDLDEIISDMIDITRNDVEVILMSDHGHGVKGEWRFYVNEWLQQNEYLKQTDNLTSESLLKRTGITVENLINLQNRIGLRNAHEYLPNALYQKLRKLIPQDATTEHNFSPQQIDWDETEVYSPQQNTLYINDSSKPEGPVTQERYQELIEELINKLKTIPHPDSGTEQPLISDIFYKSEIFEGPYYDKAPDIVFIADEMRCSASMGFKGEVFTSHRWGEHRKHGILITHGPSFKQISTEFEDDIKDVFPLVLGLLGADIPESVDGKIPSERLAVDLDVRFKKSNYRANMENRYSSDESSTIEKQLEGLGYLE